MPGAASGRKEGEDAETPPTPWPHGGSTSTSHGDLTSSELGSPLNASLLGSSGKTKKKKMKVTWKKAGDLARKRVVEKKVRINRTIFGVLMLVVLPISLGLLANHYKHLLPVDFLYGYGPEAGYRSGFYARQSHASGPKTENGARKKHALGLHGESSSRDVSSDVLRMLVPETFATGFEKVYKEKLSQEVKRVYNKTVEFDVVPFDEWKDEIQRDIKKRSMGRYHMYSILATWIPTFAEQNAIQDLTGILSSIGSSYWEDVFPQVRENVAMYNNKIYTLPVDGDVILMMYNSRILSKYGLDPPETWHEWIDIAKELHGKDLDGDGKPDAGACVVTLANEYSASYFFAFASPFIQTYGLDEGIFFDPNNMKPKFTAEKYSYILELYKEMIDHSTHSIVGETSWQRASDMFLQQKCALTFNFHGGLKPILTSLKTKEEAETFRMKMIPGTRVVLSGDGKTLEECDEQRCPHADKNMVNRAPFYGEGGIGIAFNAHSKPDDLEAATSFAISLTGPEDSLPLTTLPLNLLDPYRYSHFKNVDDPESAETKVYIADGWNHQTLLNWKTDYISAFEHGNGVKDLAIYGKAQYTGEHAMESILMDLLEGRVDAEKSRLRLIKSWDTLTSRYGKEIQQKMYQKALGLPTSPLEIPIVILGVVVCSLVGLIVLVLKNRRLHEKLQKEKRHTQRINKWTSLISNNPASRLTNLLVDVKEGKQVDPKLIDALLLSMRKKGGDFWAPDLNNNEFAKVQENNKEFADYLQFNLMSNFYENVGRSSSSHSRGSLKSNRGLSSRSAKEERSQKSPNSPNSSVERTLKELLKTKSVKTTVKELRDSKDIRQHYHPDSNVFSKSLNDIGDYLGHEICSDKWIPCDEIMVLDNIGNWNIDIFTVSSKSNGHPILTIMHNILTQDIEMGQYTTSTLLDDLNINKQKFFRYVQVIETNMHPENVYHNAVHVADVVHNMLWLLTEGEMAERLHLSKMEVFGALFACMIHDFDHPGVSNDFLIRTADKRAILYNNQNVNENWHVAQAFGILHENHQELCWDEEWSEDCVFKFRKLCISMVLGTDMSKHFELLGKFRSRVGQCIQDACEVINVHDQKDRESVLVMAIKACDIAHQGKAWKLARKWATLVQEEFYSQGDKERELGLVLSPLCDRYTVDILKSQIGFIDAVLFPLFEPLSKLLDTKTILEQLEYVKQMYKTEMKASQTLGTSKSTS